MRILHISKYYEPFKGGIEKVILELAAGTVRAGDEVVVLSSNVDWRYQEDMIDGVKVVRLPRWGVAFSQPLNPSLLWQMKKWLEWADVVQVHTPNPMAEMSYLLQADQTPMIATYHCDVVKQKSLYKIYNPVAQKLLQRADQITVSTPNHIKYSEILHGLEYKTKVIPFGITDKHGKITSDIQKHIRAIKAKHDDYFLFIGRLVPYKGVDVLLRAMTTVDKNLVLVGQGPRWEAWQSLAEDLGVADRVRFVGRVDDDAEFAAYLHGCHSLVLPSIDESEAFGLVLIEAMSCAKPVITTALRSGVPWVNDQGVTGLEVQPKDPQSLSQALSILAENHSMRREMGEQALLRFQTHFSVDTMVKSYLQLYSEFLITKDIAA